MSDRAYEVPTSWCFKRRYQKSATVPRTVRVLISRTIEESDKSGSACWLSPIFGSSSVSILLRKNRFCPPYCMSTMDAKLHSPGHLVTAALLLCCFCISPLKMELKEIKVSFITPSLYMVGK